jgi:hypothetical protein
MCVGVLVDFLLAPSREDKIYLSLDSKIVSESPVKMNRSHSIRVGYCHPTAIRPSSTSRLELISLLYKHNYYYHQ